MQFGEKLVNKIKTKVSKTEKTLFGNLRRSDK